MMNNSSASKIQPAHFGRLAHPFMRFVIVGAMGFLVDALVLGVAVHVCRANPLWARFLSFAIAVLVTFELNRRWTFAGKSDDGYRSALLRYLGVQGFGFAVNFLTFSALYLTLAPPLDSPFLCLAAASLVALLVNYLGSIRLVFRAKARC